MSLVIYDEILKASGLSESELLLEIVIMLFQQEKISIGKASQLVGMNQIQFQELHSTIKASTRGARILTLGLRHRATQVGLPNAINLSIVVNSAHGL